MITPVEVETAMLLKEKNFDELVCTYYVPEIKESVYYQEYGGEKFNMNILHTASGKECFSAPTIAEVLMWLYEKHSIWILALPTITGNLAYKIIDVQLNPEHPIERPPYSDVSSLDYHNPKECYEAGIKYCLEKII